MVGIGVRVVIAIFILTPFQLSLAHWLSHHIFSWKLHETDWVCTLLGHEGCIARFFAALFIRLLILPPLTIYYRVLGGCHRGCHSFFRDGCTSIELRTLLRSFPDVFVVG